MFIWAVSTDARDCALVFTHPRARWSSASLAQSVAADGPSKGTEYQPGGVTVNRLDISNADRQGLAELYESIQLTVDQLPYTDEFERLYADFVERTGRAFTRNQVWRAWHGAR